jgi:hypothetical protein
VTATPSYWAGPATRLRGTSRPPDRTWWSCLTRPLGASIGDYLSQAPADGGLGLGTTGTSALFLIAMLALVSYLTVSKKDLLRRDGSIFGFVGQDDAGEFDAGPEVELVKCVP